MILEGVRNSLLVKSGGLTSPLPQPYLMAVSRSNLKMMRLLLRMLLMTFSITRFFMEMLGRRRWPRHEASKKRFILSLDGFTSGCLLITFTRFVTVSIPSSEALDSFKGMENLLMRDDAIARFDSLIPDEVGVDSR